MLKSYTLDKVMEESTNSIFLAGPTHRVKEGDTAPVYRWRKEAVNFLEERGFKGVVYIPEWVEDKKPENWTYSRQVDWERKAMSMSKVILFWIPRSEDLPGFTTNIEFGEWLNSGKIVIGAPPNTPNIRYIVERCDRASVQWADSLSDCIHNALTILKELTDPLTDLFFTADTHFGEERTLELSKRPFSSVEEMDWEIVKQWNGLVTEKDTVYHLGDFGNVKMLQHLKGKCIYVLPGNYDKEITVSQLKEDNRVVMLGSNHILTYCPYKGDQGASFHLVHAPEEMKNITDFYLYAHIHKLQMVKKNGLNVGVDCHGFKPIDIKTVLFYRSAILNHYDQNVFM